MKLLIIQIPCLNEEKTLQTVLEKIPKAVNGIDKIETLVIDDGSTDNTVVVARQSGVDHIIRNIGNKGLAKSFAEGLEFALSRGADILVNTDGDNQYPSDSIPDIIKPIIEGKADIVIGNRRTSKIKHFSPVKKLFQYLGTKVTRLLSGEKELEDAVSGFRAYSKEAMLQLNITSEFSYVLDTTVQASNKKLKIASVPISTNEPTRPSRLFTSIWQHIRKSSIDITRVYSMYKVLKIFLWLSLLSFIIGLIPIIRFIIFYLRNDASGKIQSLILGSMFVIISIIFFALGIIGDLLAKNRNLIEQIAKRQKKHLYED